MADKQHIFLCHNSKDKTEVEKIWECLQQRGIPSWMDRYDLQPFKDWEEQINKIIEHAICAPIFIGSSGLGPYQKQEIRRLISHMQKQPEFRMGLIILPSCLDNPVEDPEISEDIKRLHWVDFHQERPDPVEQLIWVITKQKPNQSVCLKPNLEGHLLSQQDLECCENLKNNKNLRVNLYRQVEDKKRRELEQIRKEIEEEEARIRNLEARIAQIRDCLHEQLERDERLFLNNLSLREESLIDSSVVKAKSRICELSSTQETYSNNKSIIKATAQCILDVVKQAIEDRNESSYQLLIDDLRSSIIEIPSVVEACRVILNYYESNIVFADSSDEIVARINHCIQVMKTKLT